MKRNRHDDGDDLGHEDDRVAQELARNELDERIADRRKQDRGVEKTWSLVVF
jgi:hypothetical protein